MSIVRRFDSPKVVQFKGSVVQKLKEEENEEGGSRKRSRKRKRRKVLVGLRVGYLGASVRVCYFVLPYCSFSVISQINVS